MGWPSCAVEAPPGLASLDTLVTHHTAAGLAIAVTNPVPPPGDMRNGTPRAGGGHGLVGMHERATLLGGTLDIQHTNGVFRLHAHLPGHAHRP